MKITVILLLLPCLQISVKGFSQKEVTLRVENVSLETVLKEIKKQTGLHLFYDDSWMQKTQKVTIKVSNAPLGEVLDACFKDQPLTYAIVENTITLRPKEEPLTKPGPSISVIDVDGIVIDENGTPLEGATIVIKGTKFGIVTGVKGNFVIKQIDPNAVLVVSYAGYISTEIRLSGRNHINISLKHNTPELDETVLKGYYTTTDRLNVGDVSTIKSEDIEKQPVPDPVMALEGRVPGLYISQTSGVPGSYATIQLRGQNSIANGNNPLFVVDGIPFTSTSLTSPYIGGGALGSPGENKSNNTGATYGESPFNSLSPADIESIVVLKDADATAIYGSRGANGVILITTKKGKAGTTKFDINVNSGDGTIASKMHLMNTQQYLKMRHEALANDELQPSPTNYDINGVWDTTRYTDWQKVLIGGVAHFTNIQGNLSGGNVNTQFLLGGSYSKQTTVFPGNYSDQKGSLHFNLSHTSPNKRFHALFYASYVYDNSNLPAADLTQFITLAPDAPAIYNADGSINWQNNTWNNPFAQLVRQARAITNNMIGNLTLDYELLPGLFAKASVGYTHIQLNQNILTPATYYRPPNNTNANDRSNSYATNDLSTWIIEPQLNYSRRIFDGKLDATIGSTFQQNLQNLIGQTASGFTSNALISDIAAATTIIVNGSSNTLYHYDALFGRIGYDWQERYLINLTARRDGSSRFGPGKQFGNFGAVGAGWIFSNEDFFKRKKSILSFGKLRGSYGSTGNDQITDYQYLSTYSVVTTPYQGVTGLSPTQLSNSNFAWEVDKKLEGGIDLGFLKDRILLSTSYYRDWTKNQLVGYSLPSISGFTNVEANLPATIQNTGIELSLHTINLKLRDFGWTSSFNISVPRNKLASYQNLAGSAYSTTYEIGKPLTVKFLPHYTGTDPNNGLYQFQSVGHGGDTTSPSYPGDYQFLKSVSQKYFGGFLNSFSYKGFQLDVFFQFVNQTGYNYLYLFNNLLQPGMYDTNVPTYFLNRWQKPGDIEPVQKYSTKYLKAAYDGEIGNSSFIRLKNVSLSYTLPSEWQRKLHLQNARIYVEGQNLLTITKYNGLDPEIQLGVSGQTLPPLRMVTAGIQLTL